MSVTLRPNSSTPSVAPRSAPQQQPAAKQPVPKNLTLVGWEAAARGETHTGKLTGQVSGGGLDLPADIDANARQAAAIRPQPAPKPLAAMTSKEKSATASLASQAALELERIYAGASNSNNAKANKLLVQLLDTNGAYLKRVGVKLPSNYPNNPTNPPMARLYFAQLNNAYRHNIASRTAAQNKATSAADKKDLGRRITVLRTLLKQGESDLKRFG